MASYSAKVGGIRKGKTMSATLTHHPETHIPVSDRNQAPASKKKNRRWVIAATTAAAATIAAVGFTVGGPTVDDGSHRFAETQRMASLAPQVAETQRFLAFQGQVDTSHDLAEFNRMKALDETSWDVAEARRFATWNPQATEHESTSVTVFHLWLTGGKHRTPA